MTQTLDSVAHSSNERRLVYIIGTYPLLTTTFIDREVVQLRQWGIDIQVVAIRRPPANVPLSKAQQELQKSVMYLLPVDFVKLLFSHLYFALSRPRAFWGSLFYLFTRQHPGLNERIKTLLHFGEGVYAAYQLRGKNFQEIHAHFIDRAATLALVAGRLLDKPYSLSIHAAEDIFVHPVLLDTKIEAARHAVTCTLFNKTHVEALVGRSLNRKVTCIPHGLEIDQYRPNGNSKQEPALILAVGQLAERKGFAYLIDACYILKKRGIIFQCQIIGQGPQWQLLADRIESLSLNDYVTLRGALPHEDVIEHYKMATMFVMPCIQSEDGNQDGIPNVLLEAMAMQVPVISTRISAIPELIRDNENGLLVESNDPEALAHAMQTLIESPQQAHRLGRSGRESVLKEFNVEDNVRRFATTLWPEWF